MEWVPPPLDLLSIGNGLKWIKNLPALNITCNLLLLIIEKQAWNPGKSFKRGHWFWTSLCIIKRCLLKVWKYVWTDGKGQLLITLEEYKYNHNKTALVKPLLEILWQPLFLVKYEIPTRGFILGRKFVPVPSSFAVKSLGLGVRELKTRTKSWQICKKLFAIFVKVLINR